MNDCNICGEKYNNRQELELHEWETHTYKPIDNLFLGKINGHLVAINYFPLSETIEIEKDGTTTHRIVLNHKIDVGSDNVYIKNGLRCQK